MAGLPEQFEVQGEERLYQVLEGLEEVGVEETFEDENGGEMVSEMLKQVPGGHSSVASALVYSHAR